MGLKGLGLHRLRSKHGVENALRHVDVGLGSVDWPYHRASLEWSEAAEFGFSKLPASQRNGINADFRVFEAPLPTKLHSDSDPNAGHFPPFFFRHLTAASLPTPSTPAAPAPADREAHTFPPLPEDPDDGTDWPLPPSASSTSSCRQHSADSNPRRPTVKSHVSSVHAAHSDDPCRPQQPTGGGTPDRPLLTGAAVLLSEKLTRLEARLGRDRATTAPQSRRTRRMRRASSLSDDSNGSSPHRDPDRDCVHVVILGTAGATSSQADVPSARDRAPLSANMNRRSSAVEAYDSAVLALMPPRRLSPSPAFLSAFLQHEDHLLRQLRFHPNMDPSPSFLFSSPSAATSCRSHTTAPSQQSNLDVSSSRSVPLSTDRRLTAVAELEPNTHLSRRYPTSFPSPTSASLLRHLPFAGRRPSIAHRTSWSALVHSPHAHPHPQATPTAPKPSAAIIPPSPSPSRTTLPAVAPGAQTTHRLHVPPPSPPSTRMRRPRPTILTDASP